MEKTIDSMVKVTILSHNDGDELTVKAAEGRIALINPDLSNRNPGKIKTIDGKPYLTCYITEYDLAVGHLRAISCGADHPHPRDVARSIASIIGEDRAKQKALRIIATLPHGERDIILRDACNGHIRSAKSLDWHLRVQSTASWRSFGGLVSDTYAALLKGEGGAEVLARAGIAHMRLRERSPEPSIRASAAVVASDVVLSA